MEICTHGLRSKSMDMIEGLLCSFFSSGRLSSWLVLRSAVLEHSAQRR